MASEDPLDRPQPHGSEVERSDIKLRYPLIFLGSLVLIVLGALAGSYAVREPGAGARTYKEPDSDLGETVNVSPTVRKLPMTWELDQLEKMEDPLLHSYDLVDPDKDLYRIPIERAMDAVAARGAPVPLPAPEAGLPLRIIRHPGELPSDGLQPREDRKPQEVSPEPVPREEEADLGPGATQRTEDEPRQEGAIEFESDGRPAGTVPVEEDDR